ncbi:hypothetical protein [Pseudomonas allokribbensis]|uniref:hypothetical protein n=1 Tax=Pseudomonas allokribbensis TaxID=2774460 RepID=UPI0017878786|nr:hypothetical protein [Pseudomonas allokribbensis]
MQNESGVISAFVDNLLTAARECSATFKQFPTGGQDEKLLADTIFTNLANYSLIEFKDTVLKSKTENSKVDRVYAVCSAVFSDPQLRELHDSCHLFAGDDNDGKQVLYIYRNAVCNVEVLRNVPSGKAGCLTERCEDKDKIKLHIYAKDLFSGNAKYALPVEEFAKYIDLLVATTSQGTKGSEVCLVVGYKDGSGEFCSERFESITALHVWFKAEQSKQHANANVKAGPAQGSDSSASPGSGRKRRGGGDGGMSGPK